MIGQANDLWSTVTIAVIAESKDREQIASVAMA